MQYNGLSRISKPFYTIEPTGQLWKLHGDITDTARSHKDHVCLYVMTCNKVASSSPVRIHELRLPHSAVCPSTWCNWDTDRVFLWVVRKVHRFNRTIEKVGGNKSPLGRSNLISPYIDLSKSRDNVGCIRPQSRLIWTEFYCMQVGAMAMHISKRKMREEDKAKGKKTRNKTPNRGAR